MDDTLDALRSQMPPAGFRDVGDGSYQYCVPDKGIRMLADRVRRERHALWAELAVYCDLPGARTVNGNALSVADLNLSSDSSREKRAKHLSARGNAKGIDWVGIVEEFCQRVIEAERCGSAAVDLRELERPDRNDAIKVDGIWLARRHPTILFGDGGSAKSYIGLWLAGRMAEDGHSVGLFDWELAGEDHRDRLERLFPDGMPRIWYIRCERPLVHEIDSIRRTVRERGINYAVYDSVAFACAGPPEDAEVAGAYARAVREIGVGSLHIAHISKQQGADQKPFGSVFWHNGARCTWFVKVAESTADTDRLSLALINRKSNLGKIQPAIGLDVCFEGDITRIVRSECADDPELASMLTLGQRIRAMLKRGPMSVSQISDELDIDSDTIRKTIKRAAAKGVFVELGGDGGRKLYGLSVQ